MSESTRIDTCNSTQRKRALSVSYQPATTGILPARQRSKAVARALRFMRYVAISVCMLPALSYAATDVILYLADTSFDSDTNVKIHLMRPLGTDHRIITTDYPVASASLHPDGNWISYVSTARKEIRQVHVSGTREKVLVRLRHSHGRKGPTDVKVSPNGRYVAYTRYYPGNKIGIEVYDIRSRRFSSRNVLGPETGRNRSQIIVRRLLWSPDSKTLAASVDHTRQRLLINDDWSGDRYTFVYARQTGKVLRRLRYVEISDREPLDFLSNTELLQFGFHGDGVYTTNGLWRYNIRTNTAVKMFNTTTLSTIKGLAVSPSRRYVSMDINHLTNINGDIGFQPWRSVTGVPRVPGREWYRTFATLNLDNLAAQYTSPLSDYSSGMAQFDLDNFAGLYSPSFEWRSVRSAAAFGGSLCWGWRVTKRGTPGNDTIVGTTGADVIAAGHGNDTIKSGGGADIICAGDGDDIVNAGPGADTIFGDIATNQNYLSDIIYAGNDVLIGSTGNDIISGLGGNDRLVGGAGDDILSGGSGNDRLLGGAGEDDLRGSTGNDVLDGGPGDDINNGGDGTDRCTNALQTSECE